MCLKLLCAWAFHLWNGVQATRHLIGRTENAKVGIQASQLVHLNRRFASPHYDLLVKGL